MDNPIVKKFNIYCDESRVENPDSRYMVIGALYVPRPLVGDIKKEIDTGNIALFCKDLDCVMYLRIRPKTKSLQIGTFFDFGKDHTKMYQKQRRKCNEITIKQLKEAVSSGPTTSRNADS